MTQFVLELTARDQARKVLKALGRDGFREARRLGQEFERAEKQLGKVERRGTRAAAALRGGLGGVVSFLRASFIPVLLTAVAAVGGLSLFREAARDAGEFQSAVGEIRTILPSATKGAIDLERAILDLAVAQNQNEKVVARGLYQTISAGITDAAQALDVLDVAGRLAVAGVSDTASTVRLLTTVLNAFGLQASESERIADLLFTTVRTGVTTIGELSSGIGAALPSARALNIDLEEVTAALATLTKQGFSTSEAATRLDSLFRSLAKNQGQVAKALERTGIRFDDNTFKTRGFLEVLEALRGEIGDGLSGAFDVLGARAEAAQAFLNLTGDKAAVAAADLEAARNATGALERAFAEIAGESGFRVAQTIEGIGNSLLFIGEAALDAAAEVIEGLGGPEKVARDFEALARQLQPQVAELVRSLGSLVGEIIDFGSEAEVVGARIDLIVNKVELFFRSINLAIGTAVNSFQSALSIILELVAAIPGIGDALSDTSPQIKALEARLASLRIDEKRFERRDRAGRATDEERTEQQERIREFIRIGEELRNVRAEIGSTSGDAFDRLRRALAENQKDVSDLGAAWVKAAEDAGKAEARLGAALARRNAPAAPAAAAGGGAPGAGFSGSLEGGGFGFSGGVLTQFGGASQQLELFAAIEAAARAASAPRAEEVQDVEALLEFDQLRLGLLQQTAKTAAEKRTALDLELSILDRAVTARAAELNLTEKQRVELEALVAATEATRIGGAEDAAANAFVAEEEALLRLIGTRESLAILEDREFERRAARIEQIIVENGLTDDQAERLRTLALQTKSTAREQTLWQRVSELNAQSLQQFGQGAVRSLENSLVDLAAGTKSSKEAFREFTVSLVTDLIRLAVRLALTNILLAVFDGLTGQVDKIASASAGAAAVAAATTAGIATAGQVQAFADGGIVTEPTLALIGEGKNDEAVVPLKGGAIPVANLGGGGGGGMRVTFQNTIVLTSPDAKSGAQFVQDNADAITSEISRRILFDESLTSRIREAAGTGGGGTV